MKKNSISIITLSFNCLDNLKKTVDSITNQKYKDYEYIIVDGASNDGTIEYLKQLKNVKWISEKDDGISDAFNKGISMATGEYICFLNSADTLIDSDTLSYVSEILASKNDDVVIFQAIDSNGNIMPNKNMNNDAKRIWNDSRIPHQATFVKKEVFNKVGNFNKFIIIRMDYDFFMRCKLYNCSYSYFQHPIVNYDLTGVSSNPKNHYIFKKEGLALKSLYKQKITLKERISLFKSYIKYKLFK